MASIRAILLHNIQIIPPRALFLFWGGAAGEERASVFARERDLGRMKLWQIFLFFCEEGSPKK